MCKLGRALWICEILHKQLFLPFLCHGCSFCVSQFVTFFTWKAMYDSHLSGSLCVSITDWRWPVYICLVLHEWL